MKNLELQTQWIFKDKYNSRWNKEILNDIKRLKTGEPVDYIIGWKPFLNCKIDLTFKPLIPRPETEFWVEKSITNIKKFCNYPESNEGSHKKRNVVLKIADVFSGSGCIGIAVLKNIKNSKVDFYEIDSNLIKQIELNLKLNKINKSRYRVIQANIFTLPKSDYSLPTRQSLSVGGSLSKGKYDFILANPPYIALSRKNKVQKSVLKHEPKKALFSGKDGLNIIKKFIKQSKNHLNTEGTIWMEFDPSQKPLINKILKKQKYKNWEFYKDQYKKFRFVKIVA